MGGYKTSTTATTLGTGSRALMTLTTLLMLQLPAVGGAGGLDLFGFKINYNTPTTASTTALFNGNIAETYWKTANDDLNRGYAYQYDNLNRLKAAIYQKAGTATNAYNESLTYDKNGNILSLNRNGTSETVTAIDNLAYAYEANTNKLTTVTDATTSLEGFKDGNKTGLDYTYDVNGNMTIDKNKGITLIAYNHLNLPTQITFSGTNRKINYLYNATGQKLKKVVTQGTTVTTTDYLGGYQYVNNALQFFPTAEGYVSLSGTTYSYTYQYKDHLGNVRLSYSDADKNGLIANTEIVEESNYYPFGLKQTGYNNVTNSLGNSSAQKYKYNGKELQDELGLNMYDYGARNYDATIGRYLSVDNYSEAFYNINPYQYTANNPVKFVDINGDYIYVYDESGTAYKYDNGKLYGQDKDGKWNETSVEEGSYVSQILTALNTIKGEDGSVGSEFLNLFANDDINVDVKSNPATKGEHKDKNKTQGTTIYTSFKEDVKVETEKGQESMDFFLILAHELAHGYSGNLFSEEETNKAWIPKTEENGLDGPVNKKKYMQP